MEAHGGDVIHPSSCSLGVVNLGLVCIEGQNIFSRPLPCLSEVRATSTPGVIAEASLPPLGPKLDRCSLVPQGWWVRLQNGLVTSDLSVDIPFPWKA